MRLSGTELLDIFARDDKPQKRKDRILTSHVVEGTDGNGEQVFREHYLHATKGWRTRRVVK